MHWINYDRNASVTRLTITLTDGSKICRMIMADSIVKVAELELPDQVKRLSFAKGAATNDILHIDWSGACFPHLAGIQTNDVVHSYNVTELLSSPKLGNACIEVQLDEFKLIGTDSSISDPNSSTLDSISDKSEIRPAWFVMPDNPKLKTGEITLISSVKTVCLDLEHVRVCVRYRNAAPTYVRNSDHTGLDYFWNAEVIESPIIASNGHNIIIGKADGKVKKQYDTREDFMADPAMSDVIDRIGPHPKSRAKSARSAV